jgi:hypothetical protein
LRDFDQAISALKRLMTKPAAQFNGSAHSANDLEAVMSFLHAVTKAKATPAPGNGAAELALGETAA